ncbi:hypothetical protein VCRA2117O376_60058 [Vibrio crassostreae]|nr:hypothetical protein VCRA2117O378_300058 [Vibrio crassostreae]CAK2040252.1 hypothetical protein VCRA2119O381_30101 [Vibrio crassostreae]CAK2168459.1 hypothetical protein VCRA2117O376_60058 [Vibrio crassostreae]CAK2173358.1 hypothetical protein VCRA2113O351_60057 [Vibrio crassostreae]CAK2173689.1 hypothetical protein VCRA2114O367_60058 [Vibrio crassostreae]
MCSIQKNITQKIQFHFCTHIKNPNIEVYAADLLNRVTNQTIKYGINNAKQKNLS